MPSFGIVAEGITDQIVIERIIAGYFGDEDEKPSVVPVQPPPSAATPKDGPAPGGWGLVLEFLERGEHRQALQFNDYLVLHLDTDVSEQKGFDVPHREDGRELSVEELAARVRQRLERIIGAEFCAEHGHRLIFAVAVHGIECWLLPLLYQDNHTGKITGCLSAANEARRRGNKNPLSTPGRKGENKDPRSYQDASRGYTKRKQLMALHDKNPSLSLFVRQLARTVPGTTPDASAPPTDEAPAADSTSPEN
jgi:hypothetical protein